MTALAFSGAALVDDAPGLAERIRETMTCDAGTFTDRFP